MASLVRNVVFSILLVTVFASLVQPSACEAETGKQGESSEETGGAVTVLAGKQHGKASLTSESHTDSRHSEASQQADQSDDRARTAQGEDTGGDSLAYSVPVSQDRASTVTHPKPGSQSDDSDLMPANTPDHRDLPSPSLPAADSAQNGHKRVSKRPAFNSWGGKRSQFPSNEELALYVDEDSYQPEDVKRAPFSVWAGKRSPAQGYTEDDLESSYKEGDVEDYGEGTQDMNEWKRAPFSVWAGKRSPYLEDSDDYSKKRAFSVWAGKRSEDTDSEDPSKRAPFSVWAGKRSEDTDSIDPSKRAAFSVWAGKRSKDVDLIESSKRAPFSVWAGKRSDDDTSVDPSKRAPFSVWAGKRSDDDTSVDPSKRAPFSVWAGKRSDDDTSVDPSKRAPFSVWAGKRSEDVDSIDPSKRAPFSVWAGKRSDSDTSADPSKRAPFSVWAGKRSKDENASKRAAFSVWAGKRSEDSDPLDSSKRAPFSVWAGKRGGEETESPDEQKRGPFGAWAGRRKRHTDAHIPGRAWSGQQSLQTRAFSVWAGKRSVEESHQKRAERSLRVNTRDSDHLVSPVGLSMDTANPAKHSVHKRAAFNAWAGKRAAFSSWAGKRAFFPFWRSTTIPWFLWKPKRTPFSAWAGKRSDSYDVDEDPYKRAAFSSWAGKRSVSLGGEHSLTAEIPLEDLLNNRGNAVSDGATNSKREAFSAWAGKRSGQDHTGQSALNVQMPLFKADMFPSSLFSTDGMDPVKVESLLADGDSSMPDRFLLEHTLFSPSSLSPYSQGVPALLTDHSEEPSSDSMTLPSKRMWHLGFGSMGSWYQRRGRQQTARKLGQYLRRAMSQSPNKRRFSSWAGKRSVMAGPGVWQETGRR